MFILLMQLPFERFCKKIFRGAKPRFRQAAPSPLPSGKPRAQKFRSYYRSRFAFAAREKNFEKKRDW